jgi:hypothetical protein
MRFHEINDNEWKEMNEEERITVLLTYGMDRKEAWELSDAKRVSDLPGELLPLIVEKSQHPTLPSKILKIVNASDKPLHTLEVVRTNLKASDYQVKMSLIRLMNEGKISGRLLDVARGVWIWWPKDAFRKVRN